MHTLSNSCSSCSSCFYDENTIIGIKELSLKIHKSVATISTWASDAPERLPPRFPDGSNSVLFRIKEVNWWINYIAENGAPPPPPLPPSGYFKQEEKKKGGKRGAPTAAEKLEAKNSGLTIKELRKTKGAA